MKIKIGSVFFFVIYHSCFQLSKLLVLALFYLFIFLALPEHLLIIPFYNCKQLGKFRFLSYKQKRKHYLPKRDFNIVDHNTGIKKILE